MESDRRARWSTPTFLVAFGVVLFLLAWISRMFLFPLALALSAAVMLGPLYEKLVQTMKGRRGWAALLMSLLTFVGVFAPLGLVGVLLIQSAIPLIDKAGEFLTSGNVGELTERLLPKQVLEFVDPAAVRENVGKSLAGVGASLAGFVTAVPAFLGNMVIHATVAFIALFVYFARGPQLVSAIVEATPMERRHTRALLQTVG